MVIVAHRQQLYVSKGTLLAAHTAFLESKKALFQGIHKRAHK